MIGLAGCNLFTSKANQEEPIVRVYDKFMYPSDLEEQMPQYSTSADSALKAEALINQWIDQQVLLYKAENNISEELEKSFERKLEQYRNDLLVYSYERQLVNQMLDTAISDEEVSEYYELNKKDFKLVDYLVKVRYVKLDTNVTQLDKFKRLINRNSEEDIEEFVDLSHQYAMNFYVNEENWLYYDDLLREVPLGDKYQPEIILPQKALIEFRNGDYIYVLKITDYKLKNGISPLSVERQTIKNMILNERKIRLIQKIQKGIYDEALSKKEIEWYQE